MGAKIPQTIDKLKRLFPVRGKALAWTHPGVAKEWHPTKNKGYKPDQFSYGSNVAVWWKCTEDPSHEWLARIYNRTLQGSGCPTCHNGAATDLREFPEVLSTFLTAKNRGIDPTRLPWHAKIWWKCPKAKDHIWKSTFNRRPGERCPYCRGKKASSTNNLSQNSEIAKQWHPTKNGKLKPSEVCLGSAKRVWWKCKKGPDHQWQARVMTRTRGEGGCPFCLNQRVSHTNCLESVHPEILSEWHPHLNGKLKPKDVTAASTLKVWWKCDQGPDHEWQALVLSRTTLKTGCPFCCNKKLSVTNCLTTVNPKAAQEWHPTKNGKLKPSFVIGLTFKKAWFLCSNCGHEWRTSPQLRTARGYGCPSCRYTRVSETRKQELAANRVDTLEGEKKTKAKTGKVKASPVKAEKAKASKVKATKVKATKVQATAVSKTKKTVSKKAVVAKVGKKSAGARAGAKKSAK